VGVADGIAVGDTGVAVAGTEGSVGGMVVFVGFGVVDAVIVDVGAEVLVGGIGVFNESEYAHPFMRTTTKTKTMIFLMDNIKFLQGMNGKHLENFGHRYQCHSKVIDLHQ
jgi:hypothetical protein